MPTLEKSDVALRLLERAIEMYFDGEDALFSMSLAHSAHLLLKDLAEQAFPGASAMRLVHRQLVDQGKTASDDGLAIEQFKDFLNFLHKAPNSAKHADRVHETQVTYDDDHALVIMNIACAHALQLGLGTQLHFIFNAWQIAMDAAVEPDDAAKQFADALFPDIRQLPREQQLTMGRRYIEQAKESLESG